MAILIGKIVIIFQKRQKQGFHPEFAKLRSETYLLFKINLVASIKLVRRGLFVENALSDEVLEVALDSTLQLRVNRSLGSESRLSESH